MALLAVPFAGAGAGTKIAIQQFKPTAEPVALGWALTPGSLITMREWLETVYVSCSWSREPIMGPNDSHTCYVVKGWGPDRLVLRSEDVAPRRGMWNSIILRWLEDGDWVCTGWHAMGLTRTGLPKLTEVALVGRFPS